MARPATKVGQAQGKEGSDHGGDSGIGRAVAIAYARAGTDILIAYLDEHDHAHEVKALIEQEGRKAVRSPAICEARNIAASSSNTLSTYWGIGI